MYAWGTEHGRNGSNGIGCGPGLYPGLRTFVELESGRYRFSVWYKTINRTIDSEVNLFLVSKDVRFETLNSAKAVRGLANEQYIKFLMRSWPPTDGEWKQISQTFELDEKRVLAIPLEPFYMEKDAWVWFDDVEIVKLY